MGVQEYTGSDFWSREGNDSTGTGTEAVDMRGQVDSPLGWIKVRPS